MHHRLLAALLMLLVLAGCAGRGRLPPGDDAEAWGHELPLHAAWPR